jgi:hypothetical protein
MTAELQIMKARRSYSDEQKAEALAGLDANAGNVARTARQLGLPRKTLDQWAKGRAHPGVAKLRHQKKEELADHLEALAGRLLDAMPGKIAGASLIHLAVAVGILIDKMILLRETAKGPGLAKGKRLTPHQRDGILSGSAADRGLGGPGAPAAVEIVAARGANEPGRN